MLKYIKKIFNFLSGNYEGVELHNKVQIHKEPEVSSIEEEIHDNKMKYVKDYLKVNIVDDTDIPMDRIILCWTGSDYEFKGLDTARYHFAVDNNGHIHNGKYSIYDNFDIEYSLDGYAKFTRGLNDHSISVAMTGMGGMEVLWNGIAIVGDYPITKKQYDVFCTLVHHLSKIYNIPITYKTVLTRAEIEETLRVDQAIRHDIRFIPFLPGCNDLKDPIYMGNLIRDDIKSIVNEI